MLSVGMGGVGTGAGVGLPIPSADDTMGEGGKTKSERTNVGETERTNVGETTSIIPKAKLLRYVNQHESLHNATVSE